MPGLPAPPDTGRLSEVERLNLPRALREFDLEALNQFEAVRLFIARAAAVRPGLRRHERQRAGGGRDRGAPARACRWPSSSPRRGSSS